MLVFNQIFWILFPLKSSYCGKNFVSIQVVLNVWEQFEVQNPHIFALQWTLATYNFFIHCLFPIIFVGKVAHTSLVCVVKISYQSKKLWVTEKHFSRRRSNHRCDFCYFFHFVLAFQNNFADTMTMTQLSNIFFHQCVCMLVLNHFLVNFYFIWVVVGFEFHLQMCF